MKTYAVLDSLEQDLGFSPKTLYGLSNNLDRHYRNTFIPKHDGSKRKLSIPDLILKRVQRSIADNILFRGMQWHIREAATFKKMQLCTLESKKC